MSSGTEDPRRYVALLHWKARREERLEALVRLGEAAIPALIEGLGGGSDVQEACVTALVQIGPASRVAILTALENPAPRVRSGAVEALSRLGQDEPDATGWLLPLLRDESSDVRRTALQALVWMGLPDELVSAKLIEMSSDESADVRAAAARALGALREPPPEAVFTLLRVVANNPAGWVTAEARRALKRLDGAVVPHAIDALASPDAALRRAAAESLASLGRPTEPAIPALVAHLLDNDDQVRSSCARALGQTADPPEIVVSALIDRFRHDTSSHVKWQTLLSLQSLGAAACGATPALLESLRRADGADPDGRFLRQAISSAIAALGRKAFEQVVDALGDSDPLGHQELGEVLNYVGWPAVPVLVRRLRSGQSEHLARALRELAPDHAEGFISTIRGEAHDGDVASAADRMLRAIALRPRPAETPRAPEPSENRAYSLTERPDPLTFSAYYPTEARPEVWYTLLAYAHLGNHSEDVDVDARGRVDSTARSRRGHAGPATRSRGTRQSTSYPSCRGGTSTLAPSRSSGRRIGTGSSSGSERACRTPRSRSSAPPTGAWRSTWNPFV